MIKSWIFEFFAPPQPPFNPATSQAWFNAYLDHLANGRLWSFDNLCLTPRPVQQPSPPKRVTVVSTAHV